MSRRVRTIRLLCWPAAVVLMLVAACGDDDSPTDPGIAATGTVILDPSPPALAPPWTLSGPNGYVETGAGTHHVNDAAVGEYSVTWGDVADRATPAGETKILTADGAAIFSATYREMGVVVVDPSPDSVDAPWSLTGPGEFTESGTGDRTMAGVVAGVYRITWGAVPDHVTPPVWRLLLVGGETVTFRTIYPRLRQVAAGSFTMGSPPSELGHEADEATHDVVLTTPFVVLEHEVTNRHYIELAQWAFDTGLCAMINGSLRDATDFSSDRLLDLNVATSEISFADFDFAVDAGKEDHPVKHVTWHGAAAFCNWLSLQAGLTPAYDQDSWECNGGDAYGATGYRLPTEAEWEYACRAGSMSAFANGEITETGCGDPVLALIGWHCDDGIDSSQPMGQLQANAWDLLDMHGNVFEWCHDLYGVYAGGETNPTGAPSGLNRVMRGGSWNTNAQFCRSASRADFAPFQSAPAIGFRPVRSVAR